MTPSIVVMDPSLHDSINADAEIICLDSTCEFSEGPIWSDKGYYLFSDIPKNIINKIGPGIAKEVYLQDSGGKDFTEDVYPHMKGSNGLAFYADGELLICQHGSHGIAQYSGGEIQPFITGYGGQAFNSPNDIIVHGDGRIFFSDPPYGLQGQKLLSQKFQPKAGIYSWLDGDVELLFDAYQYPNGVCLSPDQSILYACSNKPFERYVMQFDTRDTSKRKVFCEENGDGIECDRRGNVYLCAKEGIVIVNPHGKRLGVIQLETVPANICWGGSGGNDLLITARQNIFFIPQLQKA